MVNRIRRSQVMTQATAPPRGARVIRAIALMWLSTSLAAGCENAAIHSDELAQSLGFTKQLVTGRQFRHVVYRNAAETAGRTLHVYIEGDGTPFKRQDTVADDPTSVDPLMLKLMALDKTRSIDLGRPCYNGLSLDVGCMPAYWTLRRYSPEVLDSMAAVLERESSEAGVTRIELFGHSGGGTLAVLLADRMSAVDRVVTIGANLDIDGWCRLHRYTLLDGSINPANTAQRSGAVILHLVGSNDANTPPWLVEGGARLRGNEEVRIFPGFDHRCCWKKVWPEILKGQAATAVPNRRGVGGAT